MVAKIADGGENCVEILPLRLLLRLRLVKEWAFEGETFLYEQLSPSLVHSRTLRNQIANFIFIIIITIGEGGKEEKRINSPEDYIGWAFVESSSPLIDPSPFSLQ